MEVPTFLKWAGGKKQLLGQFEPLLPLDFNDYYEPFLGSGAVFFYIRSKATKKRNYFLSDNNKDLVNTYVQVRDNLKEVISLLKDYKENHFKDEEYYYQVRDEFNKGSTGAKRASEFIYLNKTCFNGLYRVNSKGQFNVPKGSYKNPPILNEKLLKEASELLQGVEIKCLPFEKTVSMPEKGDFIYLDPPYFPLSQTASFTGYTKENFIAEDQVKLSEYFTALDKRGCKVMLSNSDTHFIKNLYPEYKTDLVYASRAINCKGEKRGKIKEVVIRSYVQNEIMPTQRHIRKHHPLELPI